MNLSDLQVGGKAQIEVIEECTLLARLQEFGVFSGSEIRYLGSAPSGCPLRLESGGTQFGLRQEQAKQIKIKSLE